MFHEEEILRQIGLFYLECQSRGLPRTKQRTAVFLSLLQTREHPTADQVFEMTRETLPRLSRASVFRILETLAASGLIRKIETPWSAARYDGDLTRHGHSLCKVCGAIGDWFDAPFERIACPQQTPSGFEISEFSFCVRGTCRECLDRK